MVIGAYPDSLVKFRGAFIRELVERGHEVHAVAGGEGKSVQASLEIIGASYSSIPLQRKGLHL